MHDGLRICAVLLLLASGGCRKERVGEGDSDAQPMREAGVAVDASATADASPGDAWPPAIDGAQHCASLRRIAGAMDVVPAWSPDAGDYPPPELDVPSGFATCKRARFPERGASMNWYVGYDCVAPTAPDEKAAAARFRELATVWRRCLAASGLRESAAQPGPRHVDFLRPSLPSTTTACSLRETEAALQMACYQMGYN